MVHFTGRKFFVEVARKAAQLPRDVRGATALMFALSLVPLLGIVGAGVDYANSVQLQSSLKAAVDSAVLAAAGSQPANSAAATTIVRNYITTNFAAQNHTSAPTVSASLDSDGGVAATAYVGVPTHFMKMLSVRTLSIKASSKAAFGTGGKAEVALALDTTGSMAGAKMTSMQQAATQLVTTLFSTPNAAKNLKMSLVPFSYYVNVGTQYRNASWMTGATDYSTTQNICQDTYPYATYTNPQNVPATCYNDGTPYDCSWTSYTVNYGPAVNVCGPVTYSYTWNGCVGSPAYPFDTRDAVDLLNLIPAILNISCSAPLTRLTNDQAAMKTQIAALTPNGETYIQSGLVWGWRTLSSKGPFKDGSADPKVQKIMVLMTDGANTHSPNYPDHEGTDVTAANKLTAETCNNAKAAGIKLYVIAFQVTDPAIKGILAACASAPPNYYDASTIAAMQGAFQSIGQQLSALRLVQ